MQPGLTGCDQHQSYTFLKSEEEVHGMYGCGRRAFQDIVDSCGYYQAVTYLLQIYDTLSGADHFAEIRNRIGQECEAVVLVVSVVYIIEFSFGHVATQIHYN